MTAATSFERDAKLRHQRSEVTNQKSLNVEIGIGKGTLCVCVLYRCDKYYLYVKGKASRGLTMTNSIERILSDASKASVHA